MPSQPLFFAITYSAIYAICKLELPTQSMFRGRGCLRKSFLPSQFLDPEPYPLTELDELISKDKLYLTPRERRLWKKEFDVPRGTKITFGQNSIAFVKDGYFKVAININPQRRSTGTLPRDFEPASRPSDPTMIALFPYEIDMRFEWYQDYSQAEPYSEWALALFAGIEKEFKLPLEP